MGKIRIKLSKKLTFALCFGLVAALLFSGCATQPSSHQTSASEAAPSVEITSIGLTEDEEVVTVAINGSEPLTYTSVKQPLPLGVVLYFPNTRLNAPSNSVPSTGTPVTSIHASQVEAKSNTARIEILLALDAAYNVIQDGTTLRLRFAKAASGSSASAAAPDIASPPFTAAVPPPAKAVANPVLKPSGTFQGTGAQIGDEKSIWVNRIDFIGDKDGRSTLSIETTAKVDYHIQKISDKLLELRLMNTSISEFRQRPLITTRFESAVNRIMPIQLPSMKDFSLFSIELREPVPYYTEQLDGLLLVHFDASSVPPEPADETHLPTWKKALVETVAPAGVISTPPKTQLPLEEHQVAVQEKGQTRDAAPVDSQSSAKTLDIDQAMVVTKSIKHYTGEKIALDFYQTDIKNVFRILRDVSGKNFAIDKDVGGKVTLTLDKPVPWDQVMDLVLRMNQLGMIVEGDIIRIATLATLNKENELRKARIASLQKEQEQIKSLEPIETRYIPISYSDASKEILPHLQNIITKGRGNVSVDSKNNQIIITDTADTIAKAQEITRQIDKVTSQVIIEARIVEVNESFSKELGFSWSGSVGEIGINSNKITALGTVAMNYPATTSNGIGLNLTRLLNTPFSLDAELTALESNGHGKILSSPKVVTLNNKKAKIKQGQEYGYLERDSSGGSSVKFKDVDLLLEVTPHVTPDNRISLNIMIQKNDVIDFIDDVPVISTNEAETQLLVNDGDTIVIGGIIKATTSKTKNAFPGLYKIPVLGWMFQSNAEEVDNNELLIFMNPKIVQLEQRTSAF